MEDQVQKTEKEQKEPQYARSRPRSINGDVRWVGEQEMKVDDEAEETGDEQAEAQHSRSRPISEPPEADNESDEEQAEDASLEKSTMVMFPSKSLPCIPASSSSCIPEGLEATNVQEVEGLYEQNVEEQAEDYPVEVEEGVLIKMQWQPDPFATEDEDKENWDPQLGPHSFTLRMEDLEQRLSSEIWSMSDDE